MVQTKEGWFKAPDVPDKAALGGDDLKLYEKTWMPDNPQDTKAVLVFVHGFSDHCNAYYNLFPTLASPPYNITVRSFDQRGWGRSVHKDAQKGLTGPSTVVIADIHAFLHSVANELATAATGAAPAPPLFLMGHSMGGQEVLQYALSAAPRTTLPPPPTTLRGVLCESPYVTLDPASEPNRLTVWGGKLMARLMPHMQMKQKLDATYMCHDQRVRDDWVNDPLCHDTGTFEGLAGMIQRSAELVELGNSTGSSAVSGLTNDVRYPLWIAHGTADRVTSSAASRKLFDNLRGPDNTYRPYDGAYHKIHAEPDGVGERFARDVGDWILQHCPQTAEAEAVKPKL